MIRLKKEMYTHEEVAEMLSIEVKQVKRLVMAGKLKAIDIRLEPNPERTDIRFLRITKDSLHNFIKNRIICKDGREGERWKT